MEPLDHTNTLPLSIAQVDSTVYLEPGLAAAVAMKQSSRGLADQEQLLAAVVARAGEVEAAEWALDQAKAACDAQIAAALSSGLPADKVAAAAGVCASVLTQLTAQSPLPVES
ncbi:hypothetical protein HER39_02330 [Arthrobacter deserti]|uniref:Uncharacterized protein n=1 Tax=Arthrobacter deserti TaxID=1742687 RepID=A0ABX1JJE4_9MICC|nr:hypothetical protein [Arthrobacter deserti]